jgi:hypothetical protein
MYPERLENLATKALGTEFEYLTLVSTPPAALLAGRIIE